MSNPAALLHAQLQRWVVDSGQSVRDVRIAVEGSEAAVIQEVRNAMIHIENIEELLGGMDAEGRRTRPYREALPRWTSWVIAYPTSWYHQQPDNRFASRHDLDILENLVDALDQTLPKYGEKDRTELMAMLDGIRKTLAADTSLPVPLRRHLHGLLAHASICLEEYEAFGDFELQKAMDRLLVSVNAAETQSSNPGGWRTFKEKLIYPVLVGLGIKAPDSIQEIAAILPPMV